MVGSREIIRFSPRPRDPVHVVTWWPPGALAIQDLATEGCRWPYGEVWSEAFAFCNAPRSRGSYCPAHARLARAGGPR